MFFQTLAHALVVVPVAVFWAAIVIPDLLQAFGVLGVTGSAAVKQIQAQVLAVVFGFLVKHNR